MAQVTYYINPDVIKATMIRLQEYKKMHRASRTPMADMCKDLPESERVVFVRAAQRLGWGVTRTKGKVYENGVFLWTINGN